MPSAAWRNADARYRERERRKLRAVESGGLYNELSTSPEWDGFFGALHDQEEAAQAAGMGYRVNLSGIGRDGFEGMDPGGRPNNKFLAQTLAAEDVSRKIQAANAERDEYNRQRQQGILNDLDTMYINHVQASDLAPPIAPHTVEKTVSPGKSDKYTIRETPVAPREAVLNALPRGAVDLRARYLKQFADEDAAAERQALEQARVEEIIRHNKELEKTGGLPRALTQTAESALINQMSKEWSAANKTNTEMNRQFQIMQSGLNRFDEDPNGASQAVLVTFQKMLDPESVVRESEYARSSHGISLMGRMKGYMERLQKGGAGVPKSDLEKMVETAREFQKNTQDAPASVKKRLEAKADRYNIPHDLVFSGPMPDAPNARPASETPEQRIARLLGGG